LLLLLLGRHLRRAGTLFDLLAHEFTPIDTLVDRKADSNAEYRDKRERQHPAWLSHNVFKSLSRREENADNPGERTDRSLRLRRGNSCCSHRGLLHHKVA